MYRAFLTCVLMVMICLLFACRGESKSPDAQADSTQAAMYRFRHDGMLDVIAKDGKPKASFRIEIVEKQDEVMRGLKNRESMDDDQAMLFIFPRVDYYEFWMQDTYMPLDMLFMSADETIFKILENAKPFSEERITPEQPNSFVLEINAGLAKKLDIKIGDKISWKRNP